MLSPFGPVEESVSKVFFHGFFVFRHFLSML